MKVRLRQCVLWCQRLWRSVRPLRVALVFVLLGAMTSVAVAWAIAWNGHETFGRLSDARRNCETFEDWIKERPTSWFRSRWVKDLDNGPRPLREGAEAELVWVANVDMIDRVGFPLHAMSVETRIVQGQRGSRRPGFSGGVLFCRSWPPNEDNRVLLPVKIDPLLMSMSACAWGGVLWLVFVSAKRALQLAVAGVERLPRSVELARGSRAFLNGKRAAVFVALGFVLSFASAWWCSWAVQIPVTQVPSAPRSLSVGDISQEAADWFPMKEQRGLQVQQNSVWGRRESRVSYAPKEEELRARLRGTPSERQVMREILYGTGWRIIEFGLPLPSMRLEIPVSTGGTARSITNVDGPIFGAIIAFNQRTWLIPLQFSVWPTVLNSVVFGTLVWLLWTGFARVLSRFKPEPGTCLSCGYDARGLARCPECGGAMSTQPVAGEVAAAGSLAGRG